MTESFFSKISQAYVRHRRFWICVLILSAAFLYAAEIGKNPAGFYLDESSVAYNAHLIAQTGADEHGVILPLYFKAFGEYKNPTFIYALAILDRIFGPSNLLARGLSAALGFAAALLLGLLAARLGGRDTVGILVAVFALFAPWLFEISRVAYEVAIFPLAVVVFLYCLRKASLHETWTIGDGGRLAASLAFLTYSYSIGRLLAPLFALGFVFFLTRRNIVGVGRAWLLYLASLVPLILFAVCNPKALIGRFYTISYIKPESTLLEIAPTWASHYLNTWNPSLMLFSGDQSARLHVPGTGNVLIGVFVLAVIGVIIVLTKHRERWWFFVLYGTMISVVPASLTNERFHSLRLAALPIFLVLLTVPALAHLFTPASDNLGRRVMRTTLLLLVVASVVQIGWFQYLFHEDRTERAYEFDEPYPEVLDAALATNADTIFLSDRDGYPSYIHAYWYGTLRGTDRSRFTRLKFSMVPPPGSVIIGTTWPCEPCPVIFGRDNFTAYRFEEQEGIRP